MKELQEVRNEVLHLKNMGVINKQEETTLLHKLNALQEAISVTVLYMKSNGIIN